MRFYCVLLKKKKKKNEIDIFDGLILFILQKSFFLSKKCYLSIYLKHIFYHVTDENSFRILNNSVYFQNIPVYNEPLELETIDIVICPILIF